VRFLAGGGIWVGLVIGFWAGVGAQVFRRALQDYRKTKESLPSLKRNMRGSQRRAVYRTMGLTAYAVVVLFVVIYVR
jgi:hypothetical protein